MKGTTWIVEQELSVGAILNGTRDCGAYFKDHITSAAVVSCVPAHVLKIFHLLKFLSLFYLFVSHLHEKLVREG